MAVTQDDLRDVRDTILTEMRSGFAGMHARQDKTNGRVGASEIQIALLKSRVRAAFSALNRRRKVRRDGDPPETADAEEYRQPYSMKVLVPSIAGAAVAISEALRHIVPAVIELFK